MATKDTKGNVGRGPTVGNAGTPAKREEFKANKASKEGTAREIANAIGARASNPPVPARQTEKNQGRVTGDVNKGRGPRKGVK